MHPAEYSKKMRKKIQANKYLLVITEQLKSNVPTKNVVKDDKNTSSSTHKTTNVYNFSK